MAKKGRRRFGKVKPLPSGRFQASYIAPDGQRHNAPTTFKKERDADRWLSIVETDISRGAWLDNSLGRELFGEYARNWIRDNSKLGPRSTETYLRNLRIHLAPLEKIPLTSLSPARIREWHAAALRGQGGKTSIAQSYRFMRAVLNTAVREQAIPRNPCQIRGAGSDRAKERPVATPAQADLLMKAITPRYRAAVAIGAWCGLRRGEIVALHRDDLKIVYQTKEGTGEVVPVEAQLRVRHNRVELLESPVAFDGDPKTDAGRREVSIPPHVIPYLVEHLDNWAGDKRLFVGRKGAPMRGDAVRQAWTRAKNIVETSGEELPTGLRFHDLRHTGQTLAAATGATVKDLMKRLGHSTPVAANRYLHAVEGRDAEIADALSELAKHGSAAKLPRSIVVKS